MKRGVLTVVCVAFLAAASAVAQAAAAPDSMSAVSNMGGPS